MPAATHKATWHITRAPMRVWKPVPHLFVGWNEWPLKATHLKTCQTTVWFGLKHLSKSPRHQCFEISCEDAWIINTQTVQRLKHSSTIGSLDCFLVLQPNKKVLERRFFSNQVCLYHVDFTQTSAPVDIITGWPEFAINVGACRNPVAVGKSCSLSLPSNLYLSTFVIHWRWWRFVPLRDPARW